MLKSGHKFSQQNGQKLWHCTLRDVVKEDMLCLFDIPKILRAEGTDIHPSVNIKEFEEGGKNSIVHLMCAKGSVWHKNYINWSQDFFTGESEIKNLGDVEIEKRIAQKIYDGLTSQFSSFPNLLQQIATLETTLPELIKEFMNVAAQCSTIQQVIIALELTGKNNFQLKEKEATLFQDSLELKHRIEQRYRIDLNEIEKTCKAKKEERMRVLEEYGFNELVQWTKTH